MNSDYKPRFSFEISEEQQMRANDLLAAYGIRKAIFCNILDDVLDIIEEHGNLAIGLMVSTGVKPRDVIKTIRQVDEVAKAKEES